MPTITIYIASRGTPLSNGETSGAGHMWYLLNLGNGGKSDSFGYAPILSKGTPLPVVGKVKPDDMDTYLSHVEAVTKEITQEQYDKLRDFGNDPGAYGFDKTKYWAPNNSCIDFVWKALEVAGLNPDGHQGSLLPVSNIEDLRKFVALSPIEMQALLQHLFPLTQDASQTLLDELLLEDIRRLLKQAELATSPIVLDLDGDSVETTANRKGGTHFDLDQSGFAEQTGWAGNDDGLLARDLNGDGKINNGSELFGNYTRLKNGQLATNGFEALKDLDDNSDGVIDVQDSAYTKLRVWRDNNGDGVNDAGELQSLMQASIRSLQVGYTDGSQKDAQGNDHRQLGSFTKTDGSQQQMDDVWFSVDTARTVNMNQITVTAQIAALPDLTGMGNVASLRQAMSERSSCRR